jgi:hypothetical protein
VDWIQLAHDRDRCRAVVNAVMNLFFCATELVTLAFTGPGQRPVLQSCEHDNTYFVYIKDGECLTVEQQTASLQGLCSIQFIFRGRIGLMWNHTPIP